MQLQQINEFLWEIPADTRSDMRVPARVYATADLLPQLLNDRSLDQLMNVTTLEGIVDAALVMPDAHEGYGFPIGGVAATAWPAGVISPGGVGYDINCGVRLLVSRLNYQDVKGKLEVLSEELYKQVPSGLGKGGYYPLSLAEVRQVLKKGSGFALEKSWACERDLEYTESKGVLIDAEPDKVSEKALKRGKDQLGTIGSGNHFVEVDRVESCFNKQAAEAFGLSPGQIVILVHTGSRGLGHQVATDHIRTMMSAMTKYQITIPDRELACVPFNSPEGQDYYKAMCAAANYAWCNRQLITHEIRNAWKNVFGKKAGPLDLLYDVAHNIAKLEEHEVRGKKMKVIVHRKGATRAFGPGFGELPQAIRHIGQPVLIPGSMGTCSYVLSGTSQSMKTSFGSTCHGAGRRLSRRAAKKQVDAKKLLLSLRNKGIFVRAGSERGAAEEAPVAYKDVNLVVDTVHGAGIASRVAKLKPLAVIKG